MYVSVSADNQPGAHRRIGVTGHLNLSTTTLRLVAAELRRHLDQSGDAGALTGVSCLARGADSVFAEVLIELGGRLEVILPSSDYRRVHVRPDHAPQFDSLIENAASVQVMPNPTAGPQAYVAANNAMLDKVDSLVAVWDGEAGLEGGTGHVVEQARTRQIPVTVIWPKGSRRT